MKVHSLKTILLIVALSSFSHSAFAETPAVDKAVAAPDAMIGDTGATATTLANISARIAVGTTSQPAPWCTGYWRLRIQARAMCKNVFDAVGYFQTTSTHALSSSGPAAKAPAYSLRCLA
jgi:hypothetical protein